MSIAMVADIFVRLMDGHRSISFVHYVWDPTALDPVDAFFRMLLADNTYRRYFLSPSDATDDPVHGPFAIEALDTSDFHPISGEEFSAKVAAFLELQLGSVDRRSTEIIGRELESLAMDSGSYMLLDPGPSSVHELGWILGEGFTEVVSVDLASGHAALVVMVID